MPYYLAATTPPRKSEAWLTERPSLQLSEQPLTRFRKHDIEHHGSFETVELAELQVARMMPKWRRLYPSWSGDFWSALYLYDDTPIRKATAHDIWLYLNDVIPEGRLLWDKRHPVDGTAEAMRNAAWNEGVEIKTGLVAYLLELAPQIHENGFPIEFIDDGNLPVQTDVRAVAQKAIKDRTLRASMIHMSITPRPKGERGVSQDKKATLIRNKLLDAGLLCIPLPFQSGFAVMVWPEDMK